MASTLSCGQYDDFLQVLTDALKFDQGLLEDIVSRLPTSPPDHDPVEQLQNNEFESTYRNSYTNSAMYSTDAFHEEDRQIQNTKHSICTPHKPSRKASVQHRSLDHSYSQLKGSSSRSSRQKTRCCSSQSEKLYKRQIRDTWLQRAQTILPKNCRSCHTNSQCTLQDIAGRIYQSSFCHECMLQVYQDLYLMSEEASQPGRPTSRKHRRSNWSFDFDMTFEDGKEPDYTEEYSYFYDDSSDEE